MVQWLRLQFKGDVGSILGQGTKILHAKQHGSATSKNKIKMKIK